MTEIKKIEKSRVEITGVISIEEFEKFRNQALKNINEEVTIDGFRKGKVPENILISKVGEMTILEEMAQLAIKEAYPKIIIDEKIDAIGQPEVHITKIAKDNPLEFKIVTAIVPEVKLGDYKKIIEKETGNEKKIKEDTKSEIEKISEQEIDEAILRIRRSRADHSGHDHEKMSAEEHEKAIDSSLPEFTDDFVKTLGSFKDIRDFKEKLRIMLVEEKKEKQKEKTRITISDKLIESSTIDLPEILIESELRRMESQFSDDISRMGVKMEDYIKHAKKSMEELYKDWRPHAEKKAKLQLILNKIAKIEKIIVEPKEIEEQVDEIMKNHKDTDQERATVYIETVLMNEKVFQFLEKISKSN
ncbi:MAG TPA: trigger factor [Candidatus Paceibacterota bacterium]